MHVFCVSCYQGLVCDYGCNFPRHIDVVEYLRLVLMYCKFGNFCEGLFSRKFAIAVFRAIKTFRKRRKLFVFY